MLQSFLLLPLSVIPVIVPVRSQIDTVPSAYVQVAEVPLPQLSRQQWEMLQQHQGTDRKPLRIHVTLSVYCGQVYGGGRPPRDRLSRHRRNDCPLDSSKVENCFLVRNRNPESRFI